MPDWARLALGTLTVLRVPAPRIVDQRTAARAMAAAPAVGLLLGLLSGAVLWLLAAPVGTGALLAAAAALGLLALLTRGLHLDGLADTADGLGSGLPGPEALAVMARGDVGPFGVVTLVLVLLLDVGALASLAGSGALVAAAALAAATLVSRGALPLACRRGVPAARPGGLGAAVAGALPRPAATVAALASVVVASGLGALAGGPTLAVALGVAAVIGLLSGLLLTRRCVSRLGGITGDTLGAAVETAFATALVGAALLVALLG